MKDYEKKFYQNHPWTLQEREWYWKFVGSMFVLLISGYIINSMK